MPRAIVPSEREYQTAIDCLRQGGIVAYPTETFYGLAVDPENHRAVAALYALKKRAADKSLSLLVPDVTVLACCVDTISTPHQRLIGLFWPGPLTIIFPARKDFLPAVNGEKGDLAIRLSSHPVAARLCALWGRPLTATSANISGDVPAITASQVRNQWGQERVTVLDGGKVAGGLGSTIVQCRGGACYILRAGAVSTEKISSGLANKYKIIEES